MVPSVAVPEGNYETSELFTISQVYVASANTTEPKLAPESKPKVAASQNSTSVTGVILAEG